MKAAKNMIGAFLIGFIVLGASAAYSSGFPSGYPAVTFLSVSQSLNIGVVADYEKTSFTSAQAENMSQTIASLLSSLLGPSLGLSGTLALTQHIAPSELAIDGFTDAADLADYALASYKSYGAQIYIFLDISRVSPVSAELGNNLRVDVWIGDIDSLLSDTSILSQLGVTGNYLYVASLEIPEKFLTLNLAF